MSKLLTSSKHSPLRINLILCIYTGQPLNNLEFPAQKEAIKYFLSEGLVTRISADEGEISNYELTEKGLHFVAMILETPLPLEVFIDPRTEEAIEIKVVDQ